MKKEFFIRICLKRRENLIDHCQKNFRRKFLRSFFISQCFETKESTLYTKREICDDDDDFSSFCRANGTTVLPRALLLFLVFLQILLLVLEEKFWWWFFMRWRQIRVVS